MDLSYPLMMGFFAGIVWFFQMAWPFILISLLGYVIRRQIRGH